MTRPGASYIWAKATASMTKGGLLFALLLSVGGLAAQSQSIRAEATVAPDFSKIDSLDKARALEAQGVLVRILLFPAEFGGEETPQNVVYVPKKAAEAKALITGTLVRFVEEDLIDHLVVEPNYKGDSIVPSRLVMKASHSTKEGRFNPTVVVW
jgi:hypothetical protein